MANCQLVAGICYSHGRHADNLHLIHLLRLGLKHPQRRLGGHMELVRAAQEAVVHERTHRADEAVDTL